MLIQTVYMCYGQFQNWKDNFRNSHDCKETGLDPEKMIMPCAVLAGFVHVFPVFSLLFLGSGICCLFLSRLKFHILGISCPHLVSHKPTQLNWTLVLTGEACVMIAAWW